MTTVRLDKYINFLTEKHVVFTALITSIMFLIFVTDLQYTTELYIGVLYIVVVMLSLWLPNNKYTFFFAVFSTAFTMFGFFYSIYNISPTTYMYQPNLINLAMTLTAIWITTIIAMYIKNITMALKTHQIIYSAILDTSIDPILMISTKGIISKASRTITKTFGWDSEEIIGKNFDSLLTHQYKDIYKSIITTNDTSDPALIGSTQEITCINRMRQEFPCEISLNYIHIPELGESFFTAVLRDISDRKSYVKKLGWLSSHDELTEIYNRRYFNIQIDKEWRRMLRSQEPLSLIILDIDDFKTYNKSLGHKTGDQCLRMIASCLEESTHRAGDIVARYGGEEFVLLMPATNLDGAKKIAEQVQELVSNMNIMHPSSSISKKVTVSMGVATMTPLRGCSYERLIRFADQALYAAKQNGRNKFYVYQD